MIRAIAITLVLLAHTFPGKQFQIVQLARIYFGYLGVELFFLLSGYLIGSQSAGMTPLVPSAEYQWWYQFYFATNRGQAGYDK